MNRENEMVIGAEYEESTERPEQDPDEAYDAFRAALSDEEYAEIRRDMLNAELIRIARSQK